LDQTSQTLKRLYLEDVLRDAVFWQQVNGIGCEIARTHIVRQGKEAILRRREGRQQDRGEEDHG